ncbi:MAG: isochorismatase family protein [Planctomycetota bacterium]
MKAKLYRLFRWARRAEVSVLSAKLLARWGHHGPFSLEPHCVDGSGGEEKLARTLLGRRIDLGLAHTADLPRDLLSDYQQVIFETLDEDVLHHQKFERLITELVGSRTFILCGAGIAAGIKQAVLGLRSRGHEVIIASDAVLDLNDPETEMAWLRILAKGARLMTVDQIAETFVPSRRRMPAISTSTAVAS